MICLRCGYCCHNYVVVIVDDPDKGVQEDNLIVHEGKGKPCKHLSKEISGEYSCKIHNEKWYKETPCYAHGQIEQNSTDPCRMGLYFLNIMSDEKIVE